MTKILRLSMILVMLSTVSFAGGKKASQKDLTCHVKGDSFVLNETDFKALTQKDLKVPIPPERFAALPPNSRARVVICDTRKLWRLVDANKLTWDDLERYENWSVVYLTNEEVEKVNKVHAKLLGENWYRSEPNK